MADGTKIYTKMQHQNYTFPDSDGTQGEVMVTNGLGVLSFQNVGAGGVDTQIQFNNDGLFDGFGVWDGENLSIPGGGFIGDTASFGILTTGGASDPSSGHATAVLGSPVAIGENGFFVSASGVPDFEFTQNSFFDGGWVSTNDNPAKIGMYGGGLFISTGQGSGNGNPTNWHDMIRVNYPDFVGTILIGDMDDIFGGHILSIYQDGGMHWTGTLSASGNFSVNGTSTLDNGAIITDGSGVIQTIGYKSSDGSSGINTTITTASLVGKTITVKNGIITGFA